MLEKDCTKLGKSDEVIKENKKKDLRVLTSRDISFSEHIDDLVFSSKTKARLLIHEKWRQ